MITDLLPKPGDIVRARSRRHLVEEVVPPPAPGEQSLVRLSCLEDDAQGEELEVLWEKEVDAQPVQAASWGRVVSGQFDPPDWFSAYYHTLRWNTVTSIDPKLFQAPFRAGIRIDAYQLEPLRKALLLPRVNLFIADDVGLGKTIEAGLIVRELLIRQKVRRIVVAAPPSVVLQWQEELDTRFGLTFVVFDRDYVVRMRQERGFAVNPWNTHSRFIVSHALLRDEAYAGPLRDWLGAFCPGSLLILDEAHNAAPASGARYAIDSQFTRVVRDVAKLFEHRLFLSATPHNGHSNSFAALLEILDPQRFCRGVPVQGARQLEAVMVRRLKEDLRQLEGGFPKRLPVQIDIDGLPADSPELRLAELLDEYRQAREDRLEQAPRSVQTASALVLCNLQKRLLSSIEAFATTLKVHRRAAEAQIAAPPSPGPPRRQPSSLLAEAPGADDDRAELSEEEVGAEEALQMERETRRTMTAGVGREIFARELSLLEQMADLAEAARARPDAKVNALVAWIKRHHDRRVLVFTEWNDTKRYLERQLRAALAPGREGDPRIAVYHGGMPDEAREEVKRAFNADPGKHPLRVLIATDAAREGVNLQNHCADLFHFDVPWNPTRMEQRNGRIDRKLQREAEVRCHYFVYAQRPEDRVLKTLVAKSATIQKELGSLAPVLERRLERHLEKGIARRDIDRLERTIDSEVLDPARASAVSGELDAVCERSDSLKREIEVLQDLLAKSRDWLRLDAGQLRAAISCGLQMMGMEPLAASGADGQYRLPDLLSTLADDPSWARTVDTLRAPRRRSQPVWEWRKQSAPRPVAFADPGSLDAPAVHLHLEHRFVQRLLGRFRSQGFVHHDLTRACVGYTSDSIPRVILLGRLSLYGSGASRLHDEILAVAARWRDVSIRKEPLQPYAGETLAKTLGLLEDTLGAARPHDLPPEVRGRLAAGAERDVADLVPVLERRARDWAAEAGERLRIRGEQEGREMAAILDAQREQIQSTLDKTADPQLLLNFDADERRQVEADKRHWQERLAALATEREREPARIRDSYQVRATRFEPAGLVYLWPVTG